MNPKVALLLSLALLAAPLAVPAQPVNVPRIGVLRAGAPPDPNVEGFRQGLRELGYVEGQNASGSGGARPSAERGADPAL
jgi:hypothetical protein